ncbi:ABC-three component system middle component 5 [Paraglaciecola sp. MB-3u-78]|uniref:ABC-three component system middle component 5 n=1 Tax=Paraglaciecola sp. MB-3u-78 TaxID=2058332 RepID=UPI00350FB2B1
MNIEGGCSFEKIRVLDFYYSFPHLLKKISPWPNDIKAYKKYVVNIPGAYEKISNQRRLFFEMNEIHKEAVGILCAKGILNKELFENGTIALDKDNLPVGVADLVIHDTFVKSDVFKVITEGLLSSKWGGKSGLKEKTGLLEYKYDE